MRFPELYRAQSARGVRFLAVPAAFAVETGRDHWEVLLRARAIENQCSCSRPHSVGRHSPERASYGRALIVDPWGLVLARAADRPCAIVAECDLAAQDECARSPPGPPPPPAVKRGLLERRPMEPEAGGEAVSAGSGPRKPALLRIRTADSRG